MVACSGTEANYGCTANGKVNDISVWSTRKHTGRHTNMFEGHTQVTCPIMVRLSCVMLCHHFLLMVCMETVLTAIQSSSWHYCKCWSQLGPIWYANGLRPVTKMGQHWLFLSRTVFVMLAHCQTPPHSWFVPETVKFVSSVDNSTTFLVIVCPFSLSVCVCV